MSRTYCRVRRFLSKQHHVLLIVRRCLCINFDLKINHMLFFWWAFFSQLKQINKVLFLLWLKNRFGWRNCHLGGGQNISLWNVDDSLDSIAHQNSVLWKTKVNLFRGVKIFFWTWVIFFIYWQLEFLKLFGWNVPSSSRIYSHCQSFLLNSVSVSDSFSLIRLETFRIFNLFWN